MTGFGRGSAEASVDGHPALHVQVEIHSINRKTLDLNFNAPREWSGYESRFSEWIGATFQRGRIQVQVKVESIGGAPDALQMNTVAMTRSLRELRLFAEQEGLDFKPDSNFLLDLARSLKDNSGLPDWKSLVTPLQAAFTAALADIDSMRLAEGAALAKDLRNRIAQLEELRLQILFRADSTTERYRDALLHRLKQLELDLDLSDERVLKELALFADRSDLSEEITRLASHFEQFLGFLDAAESSGRKMDFLCQEIHRELNTTGSKSNDIVITRHVIDSKNTLERIREQVQNIE